LALAAASVMRRASKTSRVSGFCDEDGVDVLHLREEITEVGVAARLRSESKRATKVVLIEIDHRDDIFLGINRGLNVGPSATTDTDKTEVEF